MRADAVEGGGPAGASLVPGPAVVVPRSFDRVAGVSVADELGPSAKPRYFDTLAEFLAGDDLDEIAALIPGDEDVDAATLDRLPRLRVVSVDGTGVWNQVDVDAATARGVAVCNVRGYASDTVAEFTLGAIIALARRLPAAAESVQRGQWAPEEFVGSDLRGRTIGLVGFGSIAVRVAELAQAFGMRVLCSTAHPETHRAPGVQFVELDALLERCDVLSLHARLDDTTRGLIGAAELARLRPGTLLVNTARGGLIDTDALIAALRSGRLAGAALDVTDPEPLPADSPLRGLPSVMITPHIAAGTVDARRAAVAGSLANVAAFLAGLPRSVVNPEVLEGCR
jgi:phosphoglycerate dehydrogenase-like enzyme